MFDRGPNGTLPIFDGDRMVDEPRLPRPRSGQETIAQLSTEEHALVAPIVVLAEKAGALTVDAAQND